jgi:uncharacterized membrane protein
MTLLICGLILWAATHLIPSLAPVFRQGVINKLGFNAYRGLFSLSLLAAVGFMVLGWRSSQPGMVYLPNETMRLLALAVMPIAFICLGASGRPSRISRLIRHPQLTGVLLWSLAHLLANGDTRSLTLFGGFAIWTVLEIILISRREGDWQKPEAPSLAKDIIASVVALGVMGVFMAIHPWIAGMPLF